MRSQGFTLIEIVVAIALVGLMAAVMFPNLFAPTARIERVDFITKTNALLLAGWQNALIAHKIHIVTFNFSTRKIYLKIADTPEHIDEQKAPIVKIDYISTMLDIPSQFELKNFIIEGTDETRGGTRNLFYFYIMPDGLAQDVVINMLDTKDTLPDGTPRPVGLVLNPFSAQLKEYDTFQK
jgi:prepilin-type N-terminal cleavage/methylation domain-containing protein